MAEEEATIPTDAAAEEARAKAEARRLRILEKSRERMGVVSGEQAESPAAPEEKVDEAVEAPASSPTAQSSGTARMQAMRRRRFKKAAATKEGGDESKEKEAPTESKETAAAKDTSVVDEESTTKPTEEPAVSQETKKKYKGVAKMRREMIKKKEQDKAQAKTQESEAVTTSVPILKKPPISPIPIMFHLIAVVLLFLAGLDIGWNQVAYSDVVIYRELTPTTNGISLVNRFMDTSSSKTTTLLDPSKLQETQEFVGEEEFVEQEEVYIPNIDPVFGVDFDELTKGGGLLNTLAKGAINIHRLLLQLFYYVPISILQTLIAIPQQLLATPPILCMISLVVRQTAKLAFGAKLPEPASDKSDSKDVLAMMKQGVMSFLAGMFPTVVSLYDIWTHLRSDMYVILCGVFVGLAWTHHIVETVVEETDKVGTDEL